MNTWYWRDNGNPYPFNKFIIAGIYADGCWTWTEYGNCLTDDFGNLYLWGGVI